MSEKQEILNNLEPLFERAEREGLWFNSTYRNLWFSPEELREMHDEGRFIWGPDNWRLRDPEERLQQLEEQTEAAKNDVQSFRKRMSR